MYVSSDMYIFLQLIYLFKKFCKSTIIKEPEKLFQHVLVAEKYVYRDEERFGWQKNTRQFCIDSLDGDNGIVGNVLEGIMRLKQSTT